MRKVILVALLVVLMLPLAVSAHAGEKSSSSSKAYTSSKHSGKHMVSLSELNSIFRLVYGRNPTVAEWHYWVKRLHDKSDKGSFVGALEYHELKKIQH